MVADSAFRFAHHFPPTHVRTERRADGSQDAVCPRTAKVIKATDLCGADGIPHDRQASQRIFCALHHATSHLPRRQIHTLLRQLALR